VRAAYARSAFTVYPSLMEGFGLPVLESLAHGKPCICSGRGALGEAARGGGCVALEQVDAPALAGAIETLLCSPPERARLEAAARARTFKTWSECAAEFLGWIHTIGPRR
jgi:glycosyltransferase involved in cell wall biosynthesis